MKAFNVISLFCILIGTSAVAKTNRAPFEIKIGIMDKFITGQDGNITGILLQDNTQVEIPQHLTEEILKLVKPDDVITVKGYRQSAKLMTADTIVNTSTAQTADDVDHTEEEMAAKVSKRPGGL